MRGSSRSGSQRQRRAMIAQIQRSRLGGVDRITLDMLDDEPIERYAHVYENGLGTNLHTTAHISGPDDAYATGPWRPVGVIDLDTGELA